MSTFILFFVLFLVIATSCGVLYWFFKKLNKIEVELWGEKRQEAELTAKAADEKNTSTESDDNKTEH